MTTKFAVGQRVIVVKDPPGALSGTRPETYNHIGYYGHVERVDLAEESPVLKVDLYWVKLCGRSGCEAAQWMLEEPTFNPFGFFESQLEAAD